jgi:DNA-binding Xre family transcriptional regulator
MSEFNTKEKTDLRSRFQGMNNPVKEIKEGDKEEPKVEKVEDVIESREVDLDTDSTKKEDDSSEEKKRRVGRPAKNEGKTKLYNILDRRNMSRRDLCRAVEAKFPDEPLSPDAVSRIVSGTREYYSTKTLYRICSALNLKPNDILDFEKEII